MRSTPFSSRRFLRRFLNVALWDSFSVRLTNDGPISSFQEDRRALPLSTPLSSTPGDRWCDVFSLVPAGTFPSSSTLRIFRKASHSWWLLSPSLSARSFPITPVCPVVHPQEFSNVDAEHWHMIVWACHSIVESVSVTACGVSLGNPVEGTCDCFLFLCQYFHLHGT